MGRLTKIFEVLDDGIEKSQPRTRIVGAMGPVVLVEHLVEMHGDQPEDKGPSPADGRTPDVDGDPNGLTPRP